MSHYDPKLAEYVKQWHDEAGYHYDFDEEEGVIHYGLNVGGKLNSLSIRICLSGQSIICYAVSPLKAEADKLADTAEFITRTNNGLIHGCFSLDWQDGEIHYRNAIRCLDDVAPTEEELDYCLLLPAKMFEKYGDALISVLFGFDTPAAALEKVAETEASDGEVPQTVH